MDHPRFTFRYVGRVEGQYGFRAPTWRTSRRTALDAQQFEQRVIKWLFDHLDLADCHLGNGDAPGMPALPMAFRTGSSLCLLLRHRADVVRFEQAFDVAGLTPERLLGLDDGVEDREGAGAVAAAQRRVRTPEEQRQVDAQRG